MIGLSVATIKDAAEVLLLDEVARTLDETDGLDAAPMRDGITIEGSTGQTRARPAVTEIRSHRLALARMLAQLSLPDEEGWVLPSGLKVRRGLLRMRGGRGCLVRER